MNTIFKPALTAILAMLTAVVELTAPMFILASLFVFADAVTAYRLQKRLARACKLDKAKVRFSSARFGRTFLTLARILILLLLAAMVDVLVLAPFGVGCLNLVVGAVCFWQAISLLENEAAENDSQWASKIRRILIDKARRYLDKT